MADSYEIQRHLKDHRAVTGLSQQNVADILGVTKGTISRWETGERAVDAEKLQGLAKIYGVEPFALLLSPDDLILAKRLTQAAAILRAASDKAARNWLASGRDVAGIESDPEDSS